MVTIVTDTIVTNVTDYFIIKGRLERMKRTINRHSNANGNSKTNKTAESTDVKAKQLDDTIIYAIQGLDFYIAQASAMKLGKMARILRTAKEELIFWAVDMNFHETKAEKFINQLLYANSFVPDADFREKVSSVRDKKKVLESVMKGEVELPVFS